MSEALYRKYRPQSFSEFVGQEHIVRTISNAVKNGMISHAYLFAGPRGTGKTSMARLLAKAVNCLKREDFEPCNDCLACKEIAEGNSMDLIEIDAASHRGIDDIRELREGIRFNPSSLKYKVFIIDECHQLSKAAANALLKTLEEPPEHAIFVLATTEPQKLIPTILSRCQRFNFRPLRVSEIAGKLERIVEEEGIEAEESALYTLARTARGSVRDAESMLDQVVTFAGQDKLIETSEVKDVLGLIGTEAVAEFSKMLFEKKQKEAIRFLYERQEEGLDVEEFTESLVNYLRQALILSMGGGRKLVLSALTEKEAEELEKEVENMGQELISDILEEVLEASNKMKYSPIPQLPLELAVVEICEN